ncbi:MAG: imidazole glycerol phosphate synthase subunit HisH [Acidobacteriota bacterium]
MISVFDYGAGNLQSVQNTLGAIGARYELIRDVAGIEQSHKLILPGVGHFGQMMRALDDLGVRDALINRIRIGIPFLGICLGLQALFESSEEAPEVRGLGIYPGTVRRFQGDMRIPHMGWNQLLPVGESRLLQDTGDKPYVYFANSYYCPLIAETSATCEYSRSFTAAVERYNVCGVQFHPKNREPLDSRSSKTS